MSKSEKRHLLEGLLYYGIPFIAAAFVGTVAYSSGADSAEAEMTRALANSIEDAKLELTEKELNNYKEKYDKKEEKEGD